MRIQLSSDARDARILALVARIGPSPWLQLYQGKLPTSCDVSGAGLLLARWQLPAVWMGTPSNGAAAKVGSWSAQALDKGSVNYFRLSPVVAPERCMLQGDAGPVGGGAAMELEKVSAEAGRTIIVLTFAMIDGNG